MKCPLRFTEGQMRSQHAIDHGINHEYSLPNCIEGDCAWWDSRSEHCAVHVLAWAMTETVEAQARRVDSYEDAH